MERADDLSLLLLLAVATMIVFVLFIGPYAVIGFARTK